MPNWLRHNMDRISFRVALALFSLPLFPPCPFARNRIRHTVSHYLHYSRFLLSSNKKVEAVPGDGIEGTSNHHKEGILDYVLVIMKTNVVLGEVQMQRGDESGSIVSRRSKELGPRYLRRGGNSDSDGEVGEEEYSARNGN